MREINYANFGLSNESRKLHHLCFKDDEHHFTLRLLQQVLNYKHFMED